MSHLEPTERVALDHADLNVVLGHLPLKPLLERQDGRVDRILQLHLGAVAVRAVMRHPPMQRRANRFSRNVLALTMFLPMLAAFHAKKEPCTRLAACKMRKLSTLGSTWKSAGLPPCMPTTSSEMPNGRTPLQCSERCLVWRAQHTRAA